MTQETQVETIRQSPSTPEEARERTLRKFLWDFALALLLAVVAALVVDLAFHSHEAGRSRPLGECDAKISKAALDAESGLADFELAVFSCGDRPRGKTTAET